MRFGDKTADWARRTQFAAQSRALDVKAKDDEVEQLQSNFASRKFEDFSQTQVYNSGLHREEQPRDEDEGSVEEVQFQEQPQLEAHDSSIVPDGDGPENQFSAGISPNQPVIETRIRQVSSNTPKKDIQIENDQQ